MFLGRRKTRCPKVRGMLSEYMDNLLDSADRGAVERHLEICEACSNELESLQMTVQLLNRVPFVPALRSFAIREVETGRVGIFDPRSLRWLRPATAFATVALVLLLMLDFFQVVPHDVGTGGGEVLTEPPAQIMLSPTPEGEAYRTEAGDEEPAGAIPEPTPTPAEKAPTEDVSSDELGLGVTYDGEGEVSGDSAAGWPLRQIEIAMGVLVIVLVALMFFARRQRRRWNGV